MPALQWLAVRARSHDHLEVTLDVDVQEYLVRIEVRMLAFKLVRELLRNVVKHAGVDAATVKARCAGGALCIEVSDNGRGFQWDKDRPGDSGRGFGLWSIAERVREAGGHFAVEAEPGTGTRVVMELPLGDAGAAAPMAVH
jgi:signal transduction histidine kinase